MLSNTYNGDDMDEDGDENLDLYDGDVNDDHGGDVGMDIDAPTMFAKAWVCTSILSCSTFHRFVV